ncbi:unnamed protein product [Leuciscus chuanchicus]
MDAKANNYIRKWLGLPLISLGYKLEKMRLLFELKDSPDPVVQSAKVQVRTGRRWDASQALDQAITQLKHQEVVGAENRVQSMLQATDFTVSRSPIKHSKPQSSVHYTVSLLECHSENEASVCPSNPTDGECVLLWVKALKGSGGVFECSTSARPDGTPGEGHIIILTSSSLHHPDIIILHFAEALSVTPVFSLFLEEQNVTFLYDYTLQVWT